MPRKLHRFYGAGDLHFVTFSCYRRQPLLAHSACRDRLLEILERMRRRYRLVVIGYVVMPEHVHLLVSEPQQKTLSTAVQALKLGFVRSLACRPIMRAAADSRETCHETSSSRFWQPRFYDFNVWTERKRVEKLRYIHRNPVTRGLVTSPELWPWSSYRWYALAERRPVRVNDTEILVMRVRRAR